jgi:hypothetical protein
MNKLALVLGAAVLIAALALAPMPLVQQLEGSTRYVTFYPNLLFAAPLILLGALLVLYGVAVNDREKPSRVPS